MRNKIAIAETDEEINGCFPVMAELRPHIRAEDFLPRVRELEATNGLRLVYLSDDGVKAVAGFRVGEWLAFDGTYMEVEDLVTKGGERSKGYGGELFDWLASYAARNGCTHLRLVSHVARADAHRFYERKGMTHLAHFFFMDIQQASTD